MNSDMKVWAVVDVWRGIPTGVKLFADEVAASSHVHDLRETMPQEDEVGVFEVTVPFDATHCTTSATRD